MSDDTLSDRDRKAIEAIGLGPDNVGLSVVDAAEALIHALRAGPPEVIPDSTDDLHAPAFYRGWNANAERLWTLSEPLRAALDRARRS